MNNQSTSPDAVSEASGSPSVDVVMDGRRRLLKGTAYTAPLLMTLPSVSMAALSNQLNTIGPTPVDAELAKLDPADPLYDPNLLQVLRPVYQIKKQGGTDIIEVVNMELGVPGYDCGADSWVDWATLGDRTFSPDGCDTTGRPDAGAVFTEAGSGDLYDLVGFVEDRPLVIGLVQDVPGGAYSAGSVGKSTDPVYLSTASSWNSVGPGTPLPQ